ncbi:MAG: hypothetical protein C0507_00400 [Cyanobacteria bacterium PR.3.49]|jgi:hypothetical protein|nr:hypothetical protein [Cyanobacteria bacterium PR.3.49]
MTANGAKVATVSNCVSQKSPKRHPDWDTFYQVLYVGPPRYEGTPEEREELRKAVRSFLQIESCNSEIVKVQPSFSLGLFIVWTKTEEAAENLPFGVSAYERQHGICAISD